MLKMLDLHVIIYSYKGKRLVELLNQVHKASQDLKYTITLYDQHPIKREDLFSHSNVLYKHIFWDHQTSPLIYKKQSISNPDSKYTLILSDDIVLQGDWLKDCIEFCTEKTIISGNYYAKYYNKNLFYLDKNREYLNEFKETGIIDRDFIFGFTEDLQKQLMPTYLKYNGEEECLSLMLYIKDIKIYSAPAHIYLKCNINALNLYYVPFSKDHNYNHFISLIKRYQNSFMDLLNEKEKVDSFCRKTNIDKDSLRFLPYINNDVEYSVYDVKFKNMDGRRFTTHVKEIS